MPCDPAIPLPGLHPWETWAYVLRLRTVCLSQPTPESNQSISSKTDAWTPTHNSPSELRATLTALSERSSMRKTSKKVNVLVTQSRLTLCDPMDYGPPGSSVHRILQVRILERVAIPFSGDLPDPGIKPQSPALQVHSFNIWATAEAHERIYIIPFL